MIDKDVIAQRAAKILLDTKSVLFNVDEPFTLTSGKRSPVYIDCRRLISFPAERKQLMDDAAAMLLEVTKDKPLDYLAGGETAGIPYAAFIAERMEKPMLYVRKKPKGFGRMAQIEGSMDDDGKNVALIEDLQTDGGSKKLFVDVLREAGANVEHAFVVFHYGIFKASEENMKALGITLHSLTDWWAVLKTAQDMNYFDAHTLSEVKRFLDAPTEWQDAFEAKAS
ncbi:MAG: orotate phosphoribosyltransferase [Alphaproteobacteria bacterium]|nr:orotate phosphoribosyltransferase [Alphaproteobacteria bacterium]|tara:strand:+ start:2404 stop:3078 length:675 start_codon:yes stop_codon:yes gene_type:complete